MKVDGGKIPRGNPIANFAVRMAIFDSPRAHICLCLPYCLLACLTNAVGPARVGTLVRASGSPRLTLNRMISSGRQSGRWFDTPHRRAEKHRRRMEIGGPERRSAAEDPGPGAVARRQFQRRCRHPGDVVLRPRRSGRYLESRVEIQCERI